MVLKSWTRVLILCLAVVVVYLNSFSGVFQFDDYRMVLNYARAHSFVSWLYYFSHNIRPLLKATYTLNWLSGVGLFGFHLFNLAVHIINTLLVYFIILNFLSDREYLPFKNAAFIAALLFGLHPIQTESVTYICGRSVSLMSMFYLASMLVYIIGTEKDKRILIYVLSPLLFVLAVMTRETAATLPLALFLWDMFRRRGDGTGKALKRQAVHWTICIVALGAFLFNVKYEHLLNFSYELRGIGDNLFSQFNGIGYMLSRLVAVSGLNIDPDIPAFSSWTPVLVMKALLILSLLILAVIYFKRNRWVSFGILWFFLQLIPTNSIIPRTDIANERHMYLPAMGLFLIVAIGIEKLRVGGQGPEVEDQKSEARGRRPEIRLVPQVCHSELSEESHETKEKLSRLPRRSSIRAKAGGDAGRGSSEIPILIHTCVILLMFVLGFFTWSRNSDYRSEVALWEDTVQKSPKRARCYNNLGYAYELEGRYKEAKRAYMDASNIDPEYTFAKNNIARIDKILEGNQ
jgi:protein O-mannosyl-transferase